MQNLITLVLTTLLALVLVGCSESPPPPVASEDCVAASGIQPHCGFPNPEDLAFYDGWLLISQMAGPGREQGELVAWNPDTDAKVVLWPGGKMAPGEGEAQCSAPEFFAPHGLDLRGNRLALVNHRDNDIETIELFALNKTRGNLSATWQGCAQAFDGANINDVAWLKDGFVATHMFPRGMNPMWFYIKTAVLGMDTGYVLRWSANDGWSQVPGSEGPALNGLAADADKGVLYVNNYWHDTRRVPLDGSGVSGSFAGSNIDNSTWTEDGKLLITEHPTEVDELVACGEMQPPIRSCLVSTRVSKVDPDSMQLLGQWMHQGEPFGLGTVALQVGDTIWIGSFRSDRMASIPANSLQ